VDGPADVIPLAGTAIRVGRRLDNDIVVDHPAISGAHLEIIWAQGGVYVRDLGSRNGTFLNGQRMPANQPTPLSPDAVIRLDTCLDLRLAPPGASVPMPAGTASGMIVPTRVFLLAKPQPGLVIQQRDGRRQQIALGGKTLKIGRRDDNDIVIDNNVVSGRHAEVIPYADGRYQITDLESRNGLFYKGQRIASKPLRPGDVLYIADQVIIQFRLDLSFVTQPPRAGRDTSTETRLLDLQAKKMVRIGRAPDNDLHLDDSRVSRYHAVIERVGMRYRIRDLQSDNGTFVNGKRVGKEQFIAEGDVLQIAGIKFQFVEDGLEQMDARSGLRLDAIRLNKVLAGGKNLLQDLSFSIYPREFVALVGTTGAGKSTLLDALNGFRPATHGQVLVNGTNLYSHFDAYRTELGYVPQEDIMHRELTVYEALDYAARLRMPADTSDQERAARINEVLRELDLDQRKNLPIHKLSGGQRKRVSIGIELITRPRLFFLDEATSGLDPGTELELMKLLRQLTEDPKEGRTIVLVTHATKNVMLCDKVIFLTKGGCLAFYGPPDEALKYFDRYRSQEARRLKPEFEFDDIYNLIDPDKTLPEGASEKEKLALAAQWAQRYRQSSYYEKYVATRLREQAVVPQGSAQPDLGTASRRRPRTSAWRQFAILSARYWSVMRRDPKSLLILLLQAPLIGLFSFMNFRQHIFDRVTGSPDRALTTLFLAVIIVLLFGTVNSAREITKEIPVYKRERMVNLKVGPYVFSKIFVGILFCLYQVMVYLIFTLITTDWVKLGMGLGQWSQIYVTLTLASASGVLLGLLLSAISSNDGQAVALIPVILIPQFIFAGILMPELSKVPVVPKIATSKWAVEVLATITQADLAGSQNPSIADQIAKEKEQVIEDRIRAEADRAVTEQLDAQVRDQLDQVVKQKTDEIMARETRAAQDQAEAAARREMSKSLLPVPQARQDQEVARARNQAAQEVASKRPEVEAQVRAETEGPLRIEIEKRIRDEVEKGIREKAAEEGETNENPAVKGAHDYFGDIFNVNIYSAWAAMLGILAVLVGCILVLQQRKDVV